MITEERHFIDTRYRSQSVANPANLGLGWQLGWCGEGEKQPNTIEEGHCYISY